MRHIHVLATEGLVRPDDTFVPVPTIDALLLEHTLRRRVFNLLLRRAKITPAVVDAVKKWRTSDFEDYVNQKGRSCRL